MSRDVMEQAQTVFGTYSSFLPHRRWRPTMHPYQSQNPLWDISQPASFSQLPDDDFLMLLQKQFPVANGNPAALADAVNPQSITPFALPSLSPPSDESSPSSPHEDDYDPVLKRKASDDGFDDGPSPKSQNTCASRRKSHCIRVHMSPSATSPHKKVSLPSRRKSGSGGPVSAFHSSSNPL
jgi:hypothetical protein